MKTAPSRNNVTKPAPNSHEHHADALRYATQMPTKTLQRMLLTNELTIHLGPDVMKGAKDLEWSLDTFTDMARIVVVRKLDGGRCVFHVDRCTMEGASGPDLHLTEEQKAMLVLFLQT